MLQIISIYKVTDFAPLCYCDHGRRLLEYTCVTLLEWASVPLGNTKITANNLQIRACQLELSMAVADFRNLCNYSSLAALTNWILYQPVKWDSQVTFLQVVSLPLRNTSYGESSRKRRCILFYLIKMAVCIVIGFPEAVFTKNLCKIIPVFPLAVGKAIPAPPKR